MLMTIFWWLVILACIVAFLFWLGYWLIDNAEDYPYDDEM